MGKDGVQTAPSATGLSAAPSALTPHKAQTDPFHGHTISEAGAREHEDWAKLLTRDAKPEETARILNVAIKDHGDQGAADAADLLGRFAQHDPRKAETLRGLVSRQAGRDVPFRIAPLGEGWREPSMEEKLAKAPKSPFGPADGADLEAAGRMAKVLLNKGDYQDAYAYLKSAPEATPPYMAAVHGFMDRENPALAMKFAEQGVQNGMTKPVQLAQANTGTMTDAVPASAPPTLPQAPTSPEPKSTVTARQGSTPQPTAPAPNPEKKPAAAPEMPQTPATAPTPPSTKTTVSGDFLDAIYNAEQGGKVGDQRKPDEKGTGSTEKGMYQINNGGLETIKWKDKNGNWTAEAARHGVKSDDDFLKSSTAQSVAAQSYFAKKEAVLQDRGAFGSVGQKVKGLKDTFTITDAGLLAAAHREGEKTVEAYLKHQEKNGWTSRFDNLDPQVKADLDIKRKDGTVIRTAEDRFRALETRLRTFEKVKR